MLWNIINTTIALFAIAWTVRNSKSIAKREKDTMRPAVVLKDRHHSSDLSTQYGLYFINIGRSAAINVDIPDEYLKRYNFLRKWREIRRELAPNGDETMCASGPKQFTPFIDDLVIKYEDSAGVAYSTHLNKGRIQFK